MGKALITGATGFIGTHLASRLAEAGLEVHGVARSAEAGERDGVQWWPADLADAGQVQTVMQSVRPDTVYHLASRVHGSPTPDLVLPTLRDNLVGTVNLLEAARRSGPERVVITGTMMEPRDGRPPNSPYAAAKAAASLYAQMFHELYGVPVVNLALFMVYGPGQILRKLIPHVVTSLKRGERPELSSGAWELDWVYIDDVVDALMAAAAADGVAGRAFDVGSGETVTIRQVVEHVVAIVGSDIEPAFGARDDRPLELPLVADVERTFDAIGWRARTSLLDGLRRTVEWYAKERDEDIASPSASSA